VHRSNDLCDDAFRAADFNKGVDTSLHLSWLVSSAQLDSDTGGTLRNDGKAEADDINASAEFRLNLFEGCQASITIVFAKVG